MKNLYFLERTDEGQTILEGLLGGWGFWGDSLTQSWLFLPKVIFSAFFPGYSLKNSASNGTKHFSLTILSMLAPNSTRLKSLWSIEKYKMRKKHLVIVTRIYFNLESLHLFFKKWLISGCFLRMQFWKINFEAIILLQKTDLHKNRLKKYKLTLKSWF